MPKTLFTPRDQNKTTLACQEEHGSIEISKNTCETLCRWENPTCNQIT